MAKRQKTPHHNSPERGGKFIPALFNLIGTLLMLAVIALMLPPYVSRLMGYEVYNVVSGSMEPSIPVGSMVFVKPVDTREIEPGDVIAFDSNGSVITHRVVREHTFEGTFDTKGDANEDEDIQPVPFDLVIGRVERHVPVLGEVTAVMATPLGKIYMFAFLLCGVLFNVIAGRLRDN